jgi:hypothetical protein
MNVIVTMLLAACTAAGVLAARLAVTPRPDWVLAARSAPPSTREPGSGVRRALALVQIALRTAVRRDPGLLAALAIGVAVAPVVVAAAGSGSSGRLAPGAAVVALALLAGWHWNAWYRTNGPRRPEVVLSEMAAAPSEHGKDELRAAVKPLPLELAAELLAISDPDERRQEIVELLTPLALRTAAEVDGAERIVWREDEDGPFRAEQLDALLLLLCEAQPEVELERAIRKKAKKARKAATS